jgi:hypothetical protein
MFRRNKTGQQSTESSNAINNKSKQLNDKWNTNIPVVMVRALGFICVHVSCTEVRIHTAHVDDRRKIDHDARQGDHAAWHN